MTDILKFPLSDEVINCEWVEHDSELNLGPFSFPAGLPVPVAGDSNHIAVPPWLSVPFEERGTVPTGQDDDETDVDYRELLDAFRGGHLQFSAPDYLLLVDHVGRCLLLIAAIDTDHEYCAEVKRTIENVKEGSTFFENMVRLGKANVDEGMHLSEQNNPEEALTHLLVAYALLHGAHLLSPTTPGVLFNLGILCYDLAHRFSMPEAEDEENWKSQLSAKTQYYLELALADKDIQNTTPAFYLLGVCREVTGELENARSAYQRFLDSPAVERYQAFVEEARKRLEGLNSNR